MAESADAPATSISVLPPHPVLSGFYAESALRQPLVNGLFDASAAHYDRVTSLMSFGTGAGYRRSVLRRIGVGEGSKVLDVACGTGQVAMAAQRLVGPNGTVVGVDPSAGMRAVAERKRGVRTMEGTAERLPVGDGFFDFVVMGYALRHVSDLIATFREMGRVVRPGGTVAVLEITPPERRAFRALLKLYLKRVVPSATLLATGSLSAKRLMDYYWESIEQCVSPDAILNAMGEAGLRNPLRHRTLGIFSEYTAVVRDDEPRHPR
jgi:demethylmenaquinone methyltransferase/2-methoxy-6-polyprenyl-1,4-benzoquinol methylase